MRRTYNAPTILVKDESLVGIEFDADAVAEHECGIKGIRALFGSTGNMSKVTKVPSKMCFEERGGYGFLSVGWVPFDKERSVYQQLPFEFHNAYFENKRTPKPGFCIGAWDENCFGVLSSSSHYLKQLYEIIMAKDAIVAFGYNSANNLFMGSGFYDY